MWFLVSALARRRAVLRRRAGIVLWRAPHFRLVFFFRAVDVRVLLLSFERAAAAAVMPIIFWRPIWFITRVASWYHCWSRSGRQLEDWQWLGLLADHEERVQPSSWWIAGWRLTSAASCGRVSEAGAGNGSAFFLKITLTRRIGALGTHLADRGLGIHYNLATPWLLNEFLADY